ncbi:MAG: four helix bundle protein [Sphingobacteriales bacterium]|jgi:four helix bundle protein|nr:MAG: four helix bundle protein [Sphingobacteriales bacterium]
MKFEDLRVWQKALEITVIIHNLTRSFPKEEMFILTSQIKRAADSIALNIAEGSTGNTDAEFNRFLQMANRSAIEVIACLHIAKARNIITIEDFNRIYEEINSLIRSIQALKKSIKNKEIKNNNSGLPTAD